MLVSVSLRVELAATTTLPKLKLAGVAVSAPGATPVPDKDIVSVGFDAFEVMVTVPLALPAACGANVTENVVLWDGFRVRGVVMPLSWNPVPLTLACDTLTAVPPLLVKVTVAGWVAPTVTLPNVSLFGLSESVPGATPVPVSDIVSVGFDAFEVMVTVPLALPATCGANVTENVVLCEGFRVSGVVIPLSWNPVPLTLACEMLTAEPPVLVSVTVADFVVPSVTLPNASLVGLSESVPTETPVPVSDMVSVGFDAFDVIVTVPLALPAVCGANVTENVVLCEGFSVRGAVIPLSWNPVPLMLAWETVTAMPPVLVSVATADFVVP